MGLILDSSVLIAAERAGKTDRQTLIDIAERVAGEDVAVSVVTLMEIAHGVARANTPERRTTRQPFLDELLSALPAHAVTVSVALRAGEIDGATTAGGVRIALSDLLIGVTALELGFRVATANLRHFAADSVRPTQLAQRQTTVTILRVVAAMLGLGCWSSLRSAYCRRETAELAGGLGPTPRAAPSRRAARSTQ